MKSVLVAVAFATSLSTTAMAANFLPVGPQTDVPYDTVINTWGWQEIYSSSYSLSGQALSFVLNQASTYVMVGSLDLRTNTFDVLAAALATDVTTLTALNAPHQANGSLWYWEPTLSFGFAGLGDVIDQSPFDVAAPAERDRLSWTAAQIPGCCFVINAGGRSGDEFLSPHDRNHMRVVLTTSAIESAVPEPTTWSMMILGFLGLGAALRRRPRLPT